MMGAPRVVDVRPLGLDVEREFKRAGKEIHRWRVLFNAVVGEVESLRRSRRLSQRFSAERARLRQAQLAAAGVTSDELVEEHTRLRAEISLWEEREAACCPEDVGFEEYIAVLKERLAELLAADAVREDSR